MKIEEIETRVLFTDSTVTKLGRLAMAATIKNSWGTTPRPMRVFGCYAIVYLIDGSGTYRDVNGIRHPVTAGDLIVIFPEIGHAYGPGAREHWTEIYFVFEGPVFDFWRQTGLLNPAQPVLHLEPISTWLGTFIAFAESVSGSPVSRRPEQICEFVRILTTAAATALNDPHEPADDWLITSRAALEMNLNEKLSLEHVASTVHLSYETFRKRFRERVGVSPAEFRMGKRIEAARTLLEQNQLSMKQIAVILGFADEFCFSKRFKQAVGVSPGTYRRLPAGKGISGSRE